MNWPEEPGAGEFVPKPAPDDEDTNAPAPAVQLSLALAPEDYKVLADGHQPVARFPCLWTEHRVSLISTDAFCSRCGARLQVPPGPDPFTKLQGRLYYVPMAEDGMDLTTDPAGARRPGGTLVGQPFKPLSRWVVPCSVDFYDADLEKFRRP